MEQNNSAECWPASSREHGDQGSPGGWQGPGPPVALVPSSSECTTVCSPLLDVLNFFSSLSSPRFIGIQGAGTAALLVFHRSSYLNQQSPSCPEDERASDVSADISLIFGSC